ASHPRADAREQATRLRGLPRRRAWRRAPTGWRRAAPDRRRPDRRDRHLLAARTAGALRYRSGMNDADEIDLDRLTRRLPARFGTRTLELAPASVLAYDAASWRDAIVVVTAGEIEVECVGGERGRFR